MQIRDWAASLKAICLYFDDDMAGFAVRDALAIRRLLV